MNSANYQRWNDFDWGDFIQREHLTKTFDARHLPVLRGEYKLPSRYITDPTTWSMVTPTSASRKRNRPVSFSLSVGGNVSVKRTLMWDFDNEKWVPNEMGTGTPSSKRKSSTPVTKKKKKKKKKKKSNTNESS